MFKYIFFFFLFLLPALSDQNFATKYAEKLNVTLNESTTIFLAPNTVVRVSKEKENEVVHVLSGKLRVLVKKAFANKAPLFKVQSTVMGVRGTEFFIEARPNDATVCTLEGSVEIKLQKEPLLLSAKEGVRITSEGAENPIKMDEEQMQWWRTQTDFGTNENVGTHELIEQTWWWQAPSAVNTIDPSTAIEDLTLRGNLWARALTTNIPEPETRYESTARAFLNGTWAPSRYLALFTQLSATAKSGMANPDNAGFLFHQLFFYAQTENRQSIALGRQEWDFGNGLVLGKNPWSPLTRTFDGALATFRPGKSRLRLFVGNESVGNKPRHHKQDLGGVYFDLSALPLEIYTLGLRHGDQIENSRAALGERAKWTIAGPVSLEEEFVFENSKNKNEYLGLVNLYTDFTLSEVNGFIRLGAIRSSSGFEQFYPDTHKFFGLVNTFSSMRDLQKADFSLGAKTIIGGFPMSAEVSALRLWKTSSQTVLGYEIDARYGFELQPDLIILLGAGKFQPTAKAGFEFTSPKITAFSQMQFLF